MAEYIEREALMDCIELNAREYGEEYDAWQILGDVEDFPAADVVEVVRCKDCKYGEKDEDESVLSYFCRYDGCAWNYGNHFCSYGERRNDG